MEKNFVLNGNKLIAEFMGWTTKSRYHHIKQRKVLEWIVPENSNNIYYEFNDGYLECFEERFHESWDWLIPVVEKIEKEYEVSIIDNECEICTTGYKIKVLVSVVSNSKIEAVYKAVIKFIEWYNENKE